MLEQPRPRSEGILTREFLVGVVLEGTALAAATVWAFHLGLQSSPAVGSTMAFGTLCLSRLFHGFSCKADRPVLLTRRLWNNRVLLLAFALGVILLTSVLLVPALRVALQAAALTGQQLGTVVALAFGSLLMVQLLKLFRK